MATACRPCPLCRQTVVRILHTQCLRQPDGSPLPDAYNVVACTDCGFVYADTPTAQSAYDQYYAKFSKYEDPATATGGGVSAHDRERLEALADRLLARVSPSAKVLDIGCAAGGLMAALRRKGFVHLHGVDAAPACVATLESQGFGVTQTPLSKLRNVQLRGPFDLIVLSHVLEHVVDLHPLMQAVSHLLAPRGLVYLETPDAARYEEFPFVPFYFFDSEHINHFDIDRLALLGRLSGLSVVAGGSVDLALAPGIRYPACWMWLRRESAREPSFRRENQFLPQRVASYIRQCKERENFSELERLAESGKPIILWGAGSFAQRLMGNASLGRCRLVGVVDRDRNKQGQKFAGFTVQSPEKGIADFPDAVLVIAAAVHGPAIAEEASRIAPGMRAVALSSFNDSQGICPETQVGTTHTSGTGG